MPRGAKPKRGEAGRNRTIRVPDHIWERFRAAAPDGNVTDWMIRVGEARLADSDTAFVAAVCTSSCARWARSAVGVSDGAAGWVGDRSRAPSKKTK
jgi:hypothetical protein